MFNYGVGFGAIICNIIFWLIIFFSQRSKDINENTKILHMQDFWTNGVMGDLVALSILDFVGGLVVSKTAPMLPFIFISILTATISVRIFYLYFTQTRRKKSDWGFEQKNLVWYSTVQGKMHMCYFFIQASFITMFILNMFIVSQPPIILFLTFLGVLIYGIAFKLDQNKFKSLF